MSSFFAADFDDFKRLRHRTKPREESFICLRLQSLQASLRQLEGGSLSGDKYCLGLAQQIFLPLGF